MVEYRVDYESHRRIHDRDAYALYVRVWRGDDTLGLWSTWLSGIDLAIRRSQSSTPDASFWRATSVVLAQVIEQEFRASGAPSEWESDVHYMPSAGDVRRIETVAESTSSDPLLEGEEIARFED